MSGTIKAIETRYKGYRFRSRLEARWAVFFDALGIFWEYEHEGYVLSDGSFYLPDFWLPRFNKDGLHVEVKPTNEPGVFDRAKLFSDTTGMPIWLAHGTPRPFAWDVYVGRGNADYLSYKGIPNADQASSEYRMYSEPCYEEEDGSIGEEMYYALGPLFLNAVVAARSARFDRAET